MRTASAEEQQWYADCSGASGRRIRVVDEPSFSTAKYAPIRHDFGSHPLMQIESFRKLAHELLPMGQCKFIRPDATRDSNFSLASQSLDGRGVDEIFDEIQRPGSWIALYNIEANLEYRRFLWSALGTVRHLLSAEGELFDAHGFVFISAPPSVTPFHIDRENNFWLQIRGSKDMSVWDRTDVEVVASEHVEEFVLWRSLENVKFSGVAQARAASFRVSAGDGVYFPSTTPHMTVSGTDWVRPGDEVSISIGVNFYTDATRRAANVHACNAMLRKVGIKPVSPLVPHWSRGLKYHAGRASVALRKRLRGFKPPPGFE